MDVASKNTLSPIRVHQPPFQLAFDHSDCFVESLGLSSVPLIACCTAYLLLCNKCPQML